MQSIIIYVAAFCNFWFYPLLIALVISIVIEQIYNRISNREWEEERNLGNKQLTQATRIRKFLWRQNITLNMLWFVCYFIAGFVLRTPAMPDMVWSGT